MARQKVTKAIYVHADWTELGEPQWMGTLHASVVRGKEVFSFEYEKAWLSSAYEHVLEPELQLYTGPQHLAGEEKNNFGVFLDRWRRGRMRRRGAAMARREGRPEQRLLESDYLLGVYEMATAWGHCGLNRC